MDARHLEIRVSSFNTSRISIIATGRRHRPKQHVSGTASYNSHVGECPFCPGNEYRTPPAVLVLTSDLGFRRESDEYRVRDWIVRIFPNKYPALTREYRSNNDVSLYGYHEVVVETRIHDEYMYLSNHLHVYYMLIALRRRIREIMEDPYIKNVIVIKNRGAKAGASILHPHLQLFANTFTPPIIKYELEGFRKYITSHGVCPLCRIVREIEYERLVLESKYFLAYTRYAPRQAYELLIVPKHHRAYFMESSDEELMDLAWILSRILRGIKRALNNTDYNLWIHTAPKGVSREMYHWHIEIQPVVEVWGGYEKGSGVHIVTVSPEEAARELVEAIMSL